MQHENSASLNSATSISANINQCKTKKVQHEIVNIYRVYERIATSAQTDGRIATDGPLYTGKV